MRVLGMLVLLGLGVWACGDPIPGHGGQDDMNREQGKTCNYSYGAAACAAGLACCHPAGCSDAGTCIRDGYLCTPQVNGGCPAT